MLAWTTELKSTWWQATSQHLIIASNKACESTSSAARRMHLKQSRTLRRNKPRDLSLDCSGSQYINLIIAKQNHWLTCTWSAILLHSCSSHSPWQWACAHLPTITGTYTQLTQLLIKPDVRARLREYRYGKPPPPRLTQKRAFVYMLLKVKLRIQILEVTWIYDSNYI